MLKNARWARVAEGVEYVIEKYEHLSGHRYTDVTEIKPWYKFELEEAATFEECLARMYCIYLGAADRSSRR